MWRTTRIIIVEDAIGIIGVEGDTIGIDITITTTGEIGIFTIEGIIIIIREEMMEEVVWITITDKEEEITTDIIIHTDATIDTTITIIIKMDIKETTKGISKIGRENPEWEDSVREVARGEVDMAGITMEGIIGGAISNIATINSKDIKWMMIDMTIEEEDNKAIFTIISYRGIRGEERGIEAKARVVIQKMDKEGIKEDLDNVTKIIIIIIRGGHRDRIINFGISKEISKGNSLISRTRIVPQMTLTET